MDSATQLAKRLLGSSPKAAGTEGAPDSAGEHAKKQQAGHEEPAKEPRWPPPPQETPEQLELMAKENQELKVKTRKLKLEVEEKNEIISVLREELESSKEHSERIQRDNLQLLKDSRRVKFLQDENDFLQDRLNSVEKLELELTKLKERLAELDFLKLRIGELEDDKRRALHENSVLGDKLKEAQISLGKSAELEPELDKWKLFGHELEHERNELERKLLDSIEQENKLSCANKKAEDELRRLRLVVKSHEQRLDEEQASNSLVISAAAELRNASFDSSQMSPDILAKTNNSSPILDTSIKYELEQQLEREENEENRNLKQKLQEQEAKMDQVLQTNQDIREQLDANKRLISELRQDLACEKSLALKLSNQLSNFTKQIKNIDRQYFPAQSLNTVSDKHSTDTDATSSESLPSSSNASVDANLTTTIINSHEKGSSLERTTVVTTSDSDTPKQSRQKGEEKNLSCNPDHGLQSKLFTVSERTAATNNKTGQAVDTETWREAQSNFSASKSSSPSEEKASESCRQLYNCIKTSKQNGQKQEPNEKKSQHNNRIVNSPSVANEHNANLSIRPASAATNKSTTTIESFNGSHHENPVNTGPLLVSLGGGGGGGNTVEKAHTEAQIKELTQSMDSLSVLPVKPFDCENESISKRRHGHAASGTRDQCSNQTNCSASGNNNGGYCNQNLTSVSPILEACSPSSSPSASTATVISGHDSGFQSINQDFNQTVTVKGKDQKLQSKAASTELVAEIHNRSSETSNSNQHDVPSSNQADRSLPSTKRQNVVGLDIIDHQTTKSPTHSSDQVPNSSRNINPILVKLSDGSQQQRIHAPKKSKSIHDAKPTMVDLAYAATTNRANLLDSAASPGCISQTHEDRPEAVPLQSTKSRNFIRNSLPSRSVNFGHSRPTGYLDRIRASVIATATTDTTTSYKEGARNVALTPQRPHMSPARYPYTLNCMLDHQHSARCFSGTQHIGHASPSQVILPGCRNQSSGSSRQLNALIDPVSHQRLMMNMHNHSQSVRHHEHAGQLGSSHIYPLNDGVQLNEQQMAHLNNLHHQHYYHHLQHMHQLHQMHHMHLHHHHMHHKYQQHQQQVSGLSGANSSQSVPQPIAEQEHTDATHYNSLSDTRKNGVIYSGGSQFYAPSSNAQLNQLYSNATYFNNNNDESEQHLDKKLPINRVSHERQKSEIAGFRSSTSRKNSSRTSKPNNKNQPILAQYALPQIDEVNGLPAAGSKVAEEHRARCASDKQRRNAQSIPLNLATKSDDNQAFKVSPDSSSSSPTSSTSSNLSPSSASSSSSLNSLSTSGPSMTRSVLRHTTTDINKRQCSMDRDLVGREPMKATLSRVGSCRTNTRSNEESRLMQCHQQRISAQMLTPVQSQQPSMKISKILNIGYQSMPNKTGSTQSGRENTNTSLLNANDKGDKLDKLLSSNLANLKLNDSLAFSSLNAPKNRSTGFNGVGQLAVGHSTCAKSANSLQTTPVQATRLPSSSNSSQEKPVGLSIASNKQSDNANAVAGSGNKSSVWFEYGCV